jgi:hypothetical protein
VNTFVIEMFADDGQVCSLFTVRWEGAEWSETEKFMQKFRQDPRLRPALLELIAFLDIIANERGAHESFFRFEDQAQALPPRGRRRFGELRFDFSNFELRLYCLRLSDTILVLFNGGEKNSRTAQDGVCSMQFREAKEFAKRILKALYDRDIKVSGDRRNLVDAMGHEDIVI